MEIMNVGGSEILILMLLGVIVLGPKRLAYMALQAGKLVRNLKAYLQSLSDELKAELDVLDDINEIKGELNRK